LCTLETQISIPLGLEDLEAWQFNTSHFLLAMCTALCPLQVNLQCHYWNMFVLNGSEGEESWEEKQCTQECKEVSIFQYFRVQRIHNVGAHWLFHGLWFLGLHTLNGIHVLESLDHHPTKPKHQTKYILWIRPVAMAVVLRSKNQLYLNMKDCTRKTSNMEWLFYMWQEQLATSRNSRLLNFSMRWQRWMSPWNIIHSRPNLLSLLHLTASSSLHLKNALMC
jgi:hypothetical protein